MVREGVPFVAVPAFLAIGAAIFQLWWLAIVLLLLAAFMMYFFRDPNRVSPGGEGIVLSAADGRVTRVEDTPAGKIVSVFLSPLDVHINRSPITGTVSNVVYTAGKKMPATNDAASMMNERNSLVIQGDQLTVTCTQIAGILARRIVCWSKAGDQLLMGQKFGLIKFSSRTDLLMPSDVTIEVKVGDRVRGGETVIARLRK